LATEGVKLLSTYEKLLSHFGWQEWWPGESAFEVALGAILRAYPKSEIDDVVFCSF
jgi:endonuclease III-like uncharacterized protein